MNWFFYATIFMAIVYQITLTLYYPLVIQNFTFTFPSLTVSDVPFYQNNGVYDYIWGAERYLSVQWWVIAFDATLPVLLWVPFVAFLYGFAGQYGQFRFIIVTWFVVYWVLQGLKFFYIMIGFLVFCNSVQLCRSFNGSDYSNYNYFLYMVFNLAILIEITVYMLVASFTAFKPLIGGKRITPKTFKEEIKKEN